MTEEVSNLPQDRQEWKKFVTNYGAITDDDDDDHDDDYDDDDDHCNPHENCLKR